MKQLVLALVILLMLLPQANGAELTAVNLQHMYSREFSGSTTAITDMWMGNTTTHVVIVMQFVNISNSTINVNVTMRDESSNLYLLSITVSQNTYTTILQEAASFVEPRRAGSSALLIQYIEKTVYLNPNLGEVGVYLDWSDIGGQGSLDLIGWTGMSSTVDYRAPVSGYIQFDGVSQVDRILEFDKALQSIYEQEMNLISHGLTTDTIVSEAPSEVSTKITGKPITSVTILLLAIGVAIASILFRKYYLGAKSQKKPMKAAKAKAPIEKYVRSEDVEMKYIDEIGRKVRMCCYQTARLEETYCYCGRAVEEDIQALFRDK